MFGAEDGEEMAVLVPGVGGPLVASYVARLVQKGGASRPEVGVRPAHALHDEDHSVAPATGVLSRACGVLRQSVIAPASRNAISID